MSPPAKDTVGIVVVGVGMIANAHVASINATGRAELVGVVDTDPGRAAAFSYSHGGLRCTTDLAEALSWPDCDAVVVCTPNFTHAAVVPMAISAGKHVLVEKPMATTVSDAAALVEQAAAKGVVLTAAHTHRFYDYGRTVKEVVSSGGIGEPRFGRLTILGDWTWPDWSGWMIDAQKSGGHGLHNGVHLLDLMAWWFDADPLTVRARGRKQASPELDIYDYLEMTMTFPGGVNAVCEMSRGHRTGKVSQREVTLVGTDGIVEQDWQDDSATVITPDHVQLLPAAAYDGFGAQLDAWLTAVEGGPAAMTAAEGLRAVALGVAVEESIRTGRVIEIDALLAGAEHRG